MRWLDRLLGRKQPSLRSDGRLRSELWLDRDDAGRRIERRQARGLLDDAQAAALRGFVEHGHLRFELDVGSRAAAIETAVESLWRDRPADAAYVRNGLPTPFVYGDPADRQPTYRVADPHTINEAALELALARPIFDWVERIFDMPAVAIQSFYFEWGSQELLHRDPTRVPVKRPNHLLTAWIALEDVSPASGPVTFIPGSHRWPFYQLTPSRMGSVAPRVERADDGGAWDIAQWRRVGVEPELFVPRRGEVMLWHHGLLHGGARPLEPALTRKSLVVHYSTRATMRRLRQRYSLPARADGASATTELTTDRLLSRDGRTAFDSPLRVADAAGSVPGRAALRRPSLQTAAML